ncbi:MAG TPA: hypothetical protein VJS44_10010 [Pyrinomonadaceae bacterium]|nr:hypothetical protein [Pyrinomonadaceae bacterium]
MRHTRIVPSLLVVAIAIIAVPYLYAQAVPSGNAPLTAGLVMQSTTLQRATATPTPDARQRLCMSRRADWERNRTPWSLSMGIIIFLASLYLLTYLRFKNTVARVIVSVVAALIIGVSSMAVIVMDAQKVCIDPPGFFGSLSAPMLWWTLSGSLGTGLVIYILRWLFVRRRFREELPTT